MSLVDTTPPTIPNSTAPTPLAKIPALVIDDSTAIFDSHVICEYLDSLSAAPVLFPRSGVERIKTLTLGSLCRRHPRCTALLLVYEKRFRPQRSSGTRPGWHASRSQRSTAPSITLEKAPPAWGISPDYGHVTLGCALGYLDFRHEGQMACRPSQARWPGSTPFAKAVPAFEETEAVA